MISTQLRNMYVNIMVSNVNMIETSNNFGYSPSVHNFGFAIQKPKSDELKVLEEILHVMKGIRDNTSLPHMKPAVIVHKGTYCNMCNQQDIKGIRYKCYTCVDYDLCESCESKNIHPHNFVKIIKP
jgi:hypothetical protein